MKKSKLYYFFNGYENPQNKYEESPFMAWIFFVILALVMISGISSVFFSGV